MKTVFVGLSGGVDSAVSAYLLKKEGYRVVGAFVKVWEPDFLPCTSGADRLSAMRVAAHLGIPFHTFDLAEEYKQEVVDHFIEEYRAGRTPNPDVLCNRAIKFGALWREARAAGAELIATGHYARNESQHLLRGVDPAKDQSYFLWMLTKEDLAHALFPVGGIPKSEVRKIAVAAGLPNATKRESQGLCFLGHVDMKEFLMRYIPVTRGKVVDETGKASGEHDGVAFYTLGERFPIAGSDKMYVLGKDVVKNELVIGPSVDTAGNLAFDLVHPNWIGAVPLPDRAYEAQVRYHGERHPVTLQGETVSFKSPVLAASGQSLVVYDPATDECMGGGIIK